MTSHLEDITCSANPNEMDMMMRVVDPLFDVTWSWTQTFDAQKALDKMKRRANSYQPSSAKSVASKASTIDSTLTELTMNDKIALLEKNLKKVKKQFNDVFFDDLATAMILNENLYPGIKDVDFIARYLYREDKSYSGLLAADEVSHVTLAKVFKNVFFALSKFLLEDRRGMEAMKFIILPNRVQNATYDICRKRFCVLMVEEIPLIQYALVRLSKEIKKTKPTESPVERSREPELTESALKTLDVETQTDIESDVPCEDEAGIVDKPVEESDVVKEEETDIVEHEGEDEAAVVDNIANTSDLVEEDQPNNDNTETLEVEKTVSRKSTSKSRNSKSPQQTNSIDFPTPLGLALNGLWKTPLWNAMDIPRPYAGSATRSIAPSLKSFHYSSSDDEEDSD